jgi:hypothetical protein
LLVLAALSLTAPRASAGVVVFLDYTNFSTRLGEATASAEGGAVAAFDAGEQATIRANIMTYLNTAYANYAVTFTETNPGGTFERIRFGNTAGAGSFGVASQIDYRNLSGNDVADVFTGNFGSFIEAADLRAQQIAEISASLGGTAAHELGHNLGLQHGDSYGDPGITPANYANTGGIQNTHIMATGSTGLPEAQREAQRSFGQLENAKLEFAEGVNAGGAKASTAEQAGAHGTFLTAQALALQSLPLAGIDAANVFNAAIAAAGQQDWYSFVATAGSKLTVNTVSDPIFASDVDTIVSLFAADGVTQLASNDDTFYNGNTFNGGVLHSTDSYLLNIALASGGTYYLRVTGFGNDTGNYEMIVLADAPDAGVNPVPEPGTFTLAAVAVCGLGAWSRRRRRA